ncbi:MAG: hypothetical protein KQJ78_20920 [Deltaproteobacteria bacterium]|nr:hypothetical protein [Deltaproteobacteria bacterium]
MPTAAERSAARPLATGGEVVEEAELLAWSVSYPLVGNPFFARDMLAGLGASLVILYLILAVFLAPAGGAWAVGVILPGLLLIIGIFFLAVGLFVCLVILGNQADAWYRLDPQGAGYRAGPRLRSISNAASLGNLLTGQLGPAALGRASLEKQVAWARVETVRTSPSRLVITLARGWRPLLRLYCPDEAVYARALAAVRRHAPGAAGAGAPTRKLL